MRGSSEVRSGLTPRAEAPGEEHPSRTGTPTPSGLSEALGSDDSRRWKVGIDCFQSSGFPYAECLSVLQCEKRDEHCNLYSSQSTPPQKTLFVRKFYHAPGEFSGFELCSRCVGATLYDAPTSLLPNRIETHLPAIDADQCNAGHYCEAPMHSAENIAPLQMVMQ